MNEVSNFYCIRCGKRGIPVLRNGARLRKSFHRKKLYCPHCKCYINHIECRTDEDAEQFKEDYKNGMYESEAAESVEFIRKELLV